MSTDRSDEMPLLTRGAAIGFIILGIILASLGGALYVQKQDSARFTQCTAEWQADFLSAYEARSDAAALVSDAMDGVVKAVHDQDPKAFSAAVQNYLAVRKQQINERAKNPLPPLPTVVCGR